MINYKALANRCHRTIGRPTVLAVMAVATTTAMTAGFVRARTAPEDSAGKNSMSAAQTEWQLLVQLDSQTAGDRDLLLGASSVLLEQVRTGDRLMAFRFAATTSRIYAGAVANPREAVDRVRAGLEAPSSSGGTSIGAALRAGRQALAGRPAIAVIVTNGKPRTAPGRWEHEMRAIAVEAEQWRAMKSVQIVLLGVISSTDDERSHWMIHRLAEQLATRNVVLVRSTSAAEVQAALVRFRRVLARGRAPQADGRSVGWLILIGPFLILFTIWIVANWRSREARTDASDNPTLSQHAVHTEAPEQPLDLSTLREPTPSLALTMEVRKRGGEDHGVRPIIRRLTAMDLDRLGNRVAIGSSLADTLYLPDPAIQPNHAEVRLEEDGAMTLAVSPGAEVTCLGELTIGPAESTFPIPDLDLEVGPFRIHILQEEENHEPANGHHRILRSTARDLAPVPTQAQSASGIR